jgi:glucan phosphoethanolaminetransferase (alkaline phosphatase superfamily)
VSKRTSTRWYIGSWIVWAVSLIAFAVAIRHVNPRSGFYASNPSLAGISYIILLLTLVMLWMWVAALVRLARLHQWKWFASLMLLELIGLGIVGMVAYSAAGPDNNKASRSSTT